MEEDEHERWLIEAVIKVARKYLHLSYGFWTTWVCKQWMVELTYFYGGQFVV